MTRIVLPGDKFSSSVVQSLTISKFSSSESTIENVSIRLVGAPVDRGVGGEHKPHKLRLKARSCFLCRETQEQNLDLNSVENTDIKLNLEHVFECSLESKAVCYPCWRRVETLWSPLIEFKKNTNCSPGKTKFFLFLFLFRYLLSFI